MTAEGGGPTPGASEGASHEPRDVGTSPSHDDVRGAGASAAGTPARAYGTVARLFHWTVALMVLIQIPAGIAMTSEPLLEISGPLYILHKGSGTILLLLVVARLGWRLTHRPPAFPDFMPPLEQRIAHATHLAIYALLLVMTVSGYVRTVGDGYPIELLDALGLPTLLPSIPETARIMLVVHQFAVIGLVALVAVHVSAVLRHHLIARNPVLRRMWPPVG